MKRAAIFVYGVVCYGAFFAAFLYLIGFVGDFIVPKSVNDGPATRTGLAVAIDVLLISLFGVQHTIMARPAFKRWWTRIVPKPAERSTFVLATVAVLALMFWQWRPIEGAVWSVEHPVGQAAIWAVFALGWGIVLLSTFLINHFDLFGLRQVTLYAMGKEYTHVPMQVRSLYRLVRNPLMTGFLLAFWAIPEMTLSHLVFTGAYTVYILIGVQFEERTLIHELGARYREYRAHTPMLIPNPFKGVTPAIKPQQEVSGETV